MQNKTLVTFVSFRVIRGYTMHISLVCTVKNEADNIAALLDSMLAQTCLPDEIVVNDCNSSDATPAIVEEYIAAGHPIRLVRGGHNIPTGRNNAIRNAHGELIACTDAGLTLDPRWLEEITAPLIRSEADVVAGFFRPVPQSFFELVLGATNYREQSEIKPEGFLPFGKSVAFRRAAWERVGGYPEWASHCEDLLFGMALERAGYRRVFAPEARVLFRPRGSLPEFARQYYLYARGDGVAMLWPKRHALRYMTYLGAAVITLAALRRPWLFGLHLLGAAAYSNAPLRRLRVRAPIFSGGHWFAALLLILQIRLVGDLAKMVGFPAGIVHRLRSPELQRAVEEYWQAK